MFENRLDLELSLKKMKEQEVDSLHSNGDIKIEATEVVEAKMKLEYILNGITDQDDEQ